MIARHSTEAMLILFSGRHIDDGRSQYSVLQPQRRRQDRDPTANIALSAYPQAHRDHDQQICIGRQGTRSTQRNRKYDHGTAQPSLVHPDAIHSTWLRGDPILASTSAIAGLAAGSNCETERCVGYAARSSAGQLNWAAMEIWIAWIFLLPVRSD